jgi:hemerythrin superfamily protein
MGLGESIKKDHDEYRRFFAKLSKTTGKDAQMRKDVFTDFGRKLDAHHLAEELTIIPAMKKVPELIDLAFELEVEHADMKVHFRSLLSSAIDQDIWRYKLAPLYDVMHAHWLKEEEIMIPFGPNYFTENQWIDFGRKFDEIVDDYLKNTNYVNTSRQLFN